MLDEAELPELGGLSLEPANELNELSNIHRSTGKPLRRLDTSLETAVSQLVSRLVDPLSTRIPTSRLTDLRQALYDCLANKYAPTWDEKRPLQGSGFRSLICTLHGGLPAELRAVAKAHEVDSSSWINALAWSKVVDGQEVGRKLDWEAWCDPGIVCWRYGGWQWEDVGFDPYRLSRDTIKTVWQATVATHGTTSQHDPALLQSRRSAAIPIRAPTLHQIPPTPSKDSIHNHTASLLLPAASIEHVRSHTTAGAFGAFSSPESDEEHPKHQRSSTEGGYAQERVPRLEFRRHDSRRRTAHGNSASTSSVDSTISDTNSGLSQLLTPGCGTSSADVFHSEVELIGKGHTERGRDPSPNTPHARERGHKTPATVTGATPAPVNSTTPTITPYDGGNVTVVGGGVKLGGSSRPSSVMSAHRTPMDRDRSPSISLASRALNSATGPYTTGGPRKPRTRRRIVPTYLGSLHQPGVGGPVNGVFSQFVRQPGQAFGGPGGPNVWAGQHQLQQLQPPQQQGVGVGMAPPARPAGQANPRAVSQ